MTSSTMRLLAVVVALALPGATLVVWTSGGSAHWQLAAADVPHSVGSHLFQRDAQLDAEVLEMIQPDLYRMRLYTGEEGELPVWLYVAFYSGRGSKGAHDPKVCYPSQGWDVLEIEEIPIALDGAESLTAQLMRVYQAGKTELVLYWFQPAGRWPRATWLETLLRPYDSLRRSPQYAFVRLSIPTSSEGSPREILNEFAQAVAPGVRQTLESVGGPTS